MKDRDGNEWRLVPVNATEEMIADMLASKDFDGIWPAAIAAAPQFVAGEVTKEMCWNVFEDCDGCEKNMAETARHWLDRWRKELGPTLGLVTREEMARSVEIRDTEIARLETDLELARRDAGRYLAIKPHVSPGLVTHIYEDGSRLTFTEWSFAGVLTGAFRGDTLDEAIDASPWLRKDAARAGNGGGA